MSRRTVSVQPPPYGPRQRHRRSVDTASKTQKSPELARRKAVGCNALLGRNRAYFALGRYKRPLIIVEVSIWKRIKRLRFCVGGANVVARIVSMLVVNVLSFWLIVAFGV